VSSPPSLEDKNRSSFPKVVFSSYLKFRAMDKVHKRSDSGIAVGISAILCVSVLIAGINRFVEELHDLNSSLSIIITVNLKLGCLYPIAWIRSGSGVSV
jgi:hypothetical protein